MANWMYLYTKKLKIAFPENLSEMERQIGNDEKMLSLFEKVENILKIVSSKLYTGNE